jgi:hypothetical protein
MKEVSLPAWRNTIIKHGLDTDFYAHKQWAYDAALPWSVIDSGISPDYLKAEVERALATG